MDTSRFPVATRVVIMFLAFFHFALITVHLNIVAPTNSSKREVSTVLIIISCLLLALSYFITFREIEWRYDDPIVGQNNGQDMQDLRTARTVLQLLAHTCLYSVVCLIIDERVGALGLPRRLGGRIAKWFEGFILVAIFLVGLMRVSLTSWSYRAFYGGQISWEDYQHRLFIGQEMGHAWVILTGFFTLNLILRTVNHIINLRRMELGDSVCERLLYIIAPLLLLRTGILVVINYVLPKFLGTTIGEITGSPLTLPELNDPTLTFSNLEYLEIISQLAVAGQLFIFVCALVWLLSKYAWYHWELKAVRRKPKVVRPRKQKAKEGSEASETKEPAPAEGMVEIPVAEVV